MAVIEQLQLKDYEKCNNIWNMATCEFTEKFRKEIEAGNRTVYIYKIDGEFIGEIAFVLEMNDPDYTRPNHRVYISRLLVKQEYRNQGIGGILIDHVLDVVQELGYKEATIGVDKDNVAALHLYQKKGFVTVLFDGKDEYGEFYKLLKSL
ncbi:MAG: GNAT family N-acetyltransferase [Bacteroidales bacterium]|nr:GNAT family N-acetyltransferase [Bacteroidales bacterium]